MNMRLQPSRARGAGVGGGKGGGSSSAVEEENTLLSNATAVLLDFVSQGPIKGLVDGKKSIFLDGVPLQNSNDTENFDGIKYQYRIGEEDQSPITLFGDTESEQSVNIEVTAANGAVVQTLSEENIDGFRVRVQIPSLMKVKDNGDIVAHKVEYSIEWSPAGTGQWQDITGSPFTLKGKNDSPYFRDHSFDPPTDGPWDIRMTRLSADETTVKNSSETWFDAIVGVLHQKLIYPFSAYFAWKVDAEQFGSSIPTRTYDIYGRIIRVPTNYDPETRVYTGIWDGTFKLAWTDNPAWVLLDMLTNTRYGAGLDDSKVDVASLYPIAKYCDEMVPNGYGGEEPRYTINICINKQSDAYTLINNILSNFRSMAFWAGGQFSFSQDAPNNDIAVLVTPANTENGYFTYTSSTDKSRANINYVQYNNPANQDKPDYEIVNFNSDVIKRGARILKTTAWGCRSQGQAHRHGEWLLYTLHYDTSIISYVAGMDHEQVLPGDIIAVADPLKSGSRQAGGRIVDFSANTITIDRTLTLDTSKDYQIAITQQDGSIIYRDLQTFTNNQTQLVISGTDLDITKLHKHAIWMIFRTDTGTIKYRVTSVSEKQGKRIVSGLIYNASKFPYVERGAPLETPVTDPFVGGDIQQPRYFTYTPAQVSQSGTVNRVDCLFSWTYPLNEERVTGFQLQFCDDIDAEDWRTIYTGRETSYVLQNITSGDTLKGARIRTLGPTDKDYSPWITISDIELLSRGTQPPAPTALNVIALTYGKGLRLEWTVAKTDDFWYVEVWRSLTSDFGQATLIANVTDDYFVDNELTAELAYYYWVRVRVRTDNTDVQYSLYLGPATAETLAPPLTDVLDGAITSAKIADAAITALKIAEGAVTEGAIAYDAVGANQIAANAVTAKSLVITDFTSLMKDWDFSDMTTDTINAVWDFVGGTYTGATAADAIPSYWNLQGGAETNDNQIVMDMVTAGAVEMSMTSKDYVSVTTGERIAWELQAKTSDVTGSLGFYLEFLWFDENKNALAAPTTEVMSNVGLPQDYGAAFRGKVTVPSLAKFYLIRVRATTDYQSRYVIIDRLALRRANAGELIVDGSIIADMLAANSVTATAIAAGSVTADKLTVSALSAITANIGTITSGLLRSSDSKMQVDLDNKRILIQD